MDTMIESPWPPVDEWISRQIPDDSSPSGTIDGILVDLTIKDICRPVTSACASIKDERRFHKAQGIYQALLAGATAKDKPSMSSNGSHSNHGARSGR